MSAKLVYFDSTDLHWLPDVGYSYTPIGEDIGVNTPGKANPWNALFGSLIYPIGEGVYTVHGHKRHQEVKSHLEKLLDKEPNTFWFVVMDNASAHTTPMLNEFWEKHKDNIERVPLPTYSPNLNLIERLWKFMRGQVTKNQFYNSLQELSETVVNWLKKLPFESFCSLMSINEDELVFV